MKICTKCKIEKPETDFHKCARTLDGFQTWCKQCTLARSRERQEASTGTKVRPYMRGSFKIKPVNFVCITCGEAKPFTAAFFVVDKKNHFGLATKCKLCKNQHNREMGFWLDDEVRRIAGNKISGALTFIRRHGACEACGSKERLTIDHCHEKKELRGLLCSKCNTALGMINDKVEVLRNLAAYLERDKTKFEQTIKLVLSKG